MKLFDHVIENIKEFFILTGVAAIVHQFCIHLYGTQYLVFEPWFIGGAFVGWVATTTLIQWWRYKD